MKILYLLIALAIGLSSPVFAVDSPTSINLEQSLKRVLNKNPTLQVFTFKQRAQQARQASAELRPSYSINLALDNFAGSNQYQGLDASELTVSLSSLIELGAKRDARINYAQNSYVQSSIIRDMQALDLLGETTRRFIRILQSQEQVTLAKEANGLSLKILKNTQKKSKAGASPDAGVHRAQAAVIQTELNLAARLQQFESYKMALAILWGETQADFSIVEGSLYQFNRIISYPELVEKMSANPRLKFYTNKIRLQNARLRLEKSQATTDIAWSIGARHFQETNDTALSAGFSVPLFSGRRNTSNYRAVMAERDAVSFETDVERLAMHQQLYDAYSNRQHALLTVNTLQKNIIPNLAKALQGTEKAYQQGRYNYSEYISSRQELLSARKNLIDAATAVLLYDTEIEQLTSEPLALSDSNSVNDLKE